MLEDFLDQQYPDEQANPQARITPTRSPRSRLAGQPETARLSATLSLTVGCEVRWLVEASRGPARPVPLQCFAAGTRANAMASPVALTVRLIRRPGAAHEQVCQQFRPALEGRTVSDSVPFGRLPLGWPGGRLVAGAGRSPVLVAVLK